LILRSCHDCSFLRVAIGLLVGFFSMMAAPAYQATAKVIRI
jgi:hypothetical protein